MVSDFEASQLKRRVLVQCRVKAMNESIYYIVNDLHKARIMSGQVHSSAHRAYVVY